MENGTFFIDGTTVFVKIPGGVLEVCRFVGENAKERAEEFLKECING
jgi:hypothetical protein